jgi:hypothetical protein
MKPLPGSFFTGPVVDPQTGYFLPHVLKYFQGLEIKTGPTLDLKSQIQNTAIVAGRTEGIGTTISQHDATGKLLTTDAIAADGTGSPLTGGKRGFVALNSDNRLAGSFRSNPVSTFSNFSSTNPVTATTGGAPNTATVSIAANTQKYGDGDVNYSSGSITPLNDSTTYYVYADDPTFGGDGVSYQATTNAAVLTASNGRVYFGKVITPAFGGGGTSGSGGGSGGRGNVY